MFNLGVMWKDNKIVANFGIKYLDEKLSGIMRGDLVLIGSRSGAGKSTIANMIAWKNQSKKVALFSLENFKYDLEAERAYRKFLELTKQYSVSLRDFMSGAYITNGVLVDNHILQQCEDYANEAFNGINVYNRQKEFTVDDLAEKMREEAKKGTQLIIIDHLDYLDHSYINQTDNDHITTLMRTIREVQDEFKTAVVAISHLRKPSTTAKEQPVIASIDEFIGSSNKVKEATVVVLLSPDDEGNQKMAGLGNSYLRGTWCAVRKLRAGGIDNKAAKLLFNIRTGQYEPSYELYSVNYSGSKTELIGNG